MKIEAPKFDFELIKRFLHIHSDKPNRIQVEITNRCNLDCKMCPRQDYSLPYEDMDFEFFKKIVSKLKDVDLIIPVGWGESFIHPEFYKIIDYLRQNNHKIKLTTNGLLLDSEKSRAAALKIDFLTFSLELTEKDGGNYGHNNRQIIKNIKMLVEKRGNNKKPFLCIQSVLLKDNKSVMETIKLAKELNVDRVNLVRPYTKFNRDFSCNEWKERKKLYEKADNLGRRIGMRVDMFEYASFTGVKRVFWKYFKTIFRVNSWCPRLYDFAYVTIDGRVTPCCALPRYIVGDLKIQPIEEIWQSKEMDHFRKNHINICKDCNVFRIR